MNNPLVSIVIPFHNNKDTIARAVHSCLDQTYKNIEVIAIDDFSTDESYEIIRKMDDSRIKLLKNSENLKAGLTRNRGIELAKGEYIAFLDGDDAYREDKIELDVKFMEEHPQVDLLCNQYNSMALLGEKILDPKLEYNEVTLPSMLKKACIFTSTVMMKRSIKTRFPKNFHISEDLYFWSSVLLDGYKACVTNRLTTFYNNEFSSRLSLNFRKQYLQEKRIVNMVYEHKGISYTQKVFFKFLYFLKYIRRPIKFKIIAHKEKKLAKKGAKR